MKQFPISNRGCEEVSLHTWPSIDKSTLTQLLEGAKSNRKAPFFRSITASHVAQRDRLDFTLNSMRAPKIAGRIAGLRSFVRYWNPANSISQKTMMPSAASVNAYLSRVYRGHRKICVYRRS